MLRNSLKYSRPSNFTDEHTPVSCLVTVPIPELRTDYKTSNYQTETCATLRSYDQGAKSGLTMEMTATTVMDASMPSLSPQYTLLGKL